MKPLIALVFLFIGASAAASSPTDVLNQVRAATGGDAWNRIRQIEMQGTLSIGTLQGTIATIDSLADDRSITHYDLHVAAGASGTADGVSWTSSGSGLVDTDATEAGRRKAVTDGIVSRREYLQSQIADFDPQLRREQDSDIVSIVPSGGDPLELWINVRTHLIERIVWPATRDVTRFSDYRRVQGILLPFHTESTDSTGNLQITKVSSYVVSNEIQSERYRRPASVARDIELSHAARVLPAHVEAGHVYVEAAINDSPPALFVLDTGAAVNVLTPQAAKSLHIEASGSLDATGVGEEHVSAGLTTISRVRIGPATLHDQTFAIVPLPPLAVYRGGREQLAVGVLGYDFFRRLRVTIDYDASVVKLEPLQACGATPEGAVQLFLDSHRIPLVKVSINGVEALWNLDLGDSSSLTMSASVAQRLGVPADAGIPAISEGGVGGVTRDRVLQFDELTIGSHRLPAPDVAISDQKSGEFAEPNFGGNLGFGILRNFTFTLDYDCGVLALEHSRNFGKPAPYNGLGATWHLTDAGVMQVLSIMPGSPAQSAGLKVGDELLAANGASGKQITRAFLHDLLEQPAGTQVLLRLRRAGLIYEANATLATFIPRFVRQQSARDASHAHAF